MGKYNKAYHEAHREKQNAYNREYRKHNPERCKSLALQWHYGITLEQRDSMLEAQGFRCAICGTDAPSGKKGWCVDHCHETDTVRGILCQACNTGLGAFKDNIENLRRAIAYLVKSGI